MEKEKYLGTFFIVTMQGERPVKSYNAQDSPPGKDVPSPELSSAQAEEPALRGNEPPGSL